MNANNERIAPTAIISSTFDDLVDRRPVGRLQWQTVALIAVCSTLDGFDMQSFGFLVPAISRSMHVPLASMTWAIMMGLIGLAIGALSFGRLSDRIGRRPVLMINFVFAGLSTLATARSETLAQLGALRLLAGIGLGGAVPVLTAMVTEILPDRLRSAFICVTCAAVPFGGFVASLVGARLLPAFGWPSVLIVGGLLPLAVVPILWALLPESPGFAAARWDALRTNLLVHRLWPGFDNNISIRVASQERSGAIGALFAKGSAGPTLLLWLIIFMNLLSLYFFVNWLPSLLSVAHLGESVGVRAIGAFSLGGILGQVAQGPILTRWGTARALPIEMTIVVLSVIGLAFAPLTAGNVLLIVTVLSIALQAGQAGMLALASAFYPIQLRATGLGAMLAVGRLGSIFGPFVGGLGLSLGMTPQHILLVICVPTTISLACVLILGGRQHITIKTRGS